MTILPSLRPFVTKDIGGFFADSEKIRSLVEEATGENPYVVSTSPGLPFARQISDILQQLESTKSERWLLTHVLVEALGSDDDLHRLHELIVRACPETLVTTPKLDQQIERVLTHLRRFLAQPQPPEIRNELRFKHSELQAMLQETTRLFAYKSLHESLHALQLKLRFEEVLAATLGEPSQAHLAIADACTRAAEAASLLDAGSGDERTEREWIAALGALGERVEAAAGEGDRSAGRDAIDEVVDRVRLHLVRLDGRLFEVARRLSFSAIVEAPSNEFRERPEFDDFAYAVRELRPTILARALKHRMWQDAERELPLVAALFDLPGPATTETTNHWFRFKARVIWLAGLDPDAGWSADARALADQISDALAAAEKRDSIGPCRESFGKLIALCFFAIDAMLKTDCTVLRKVDEPVNAILKDLARG